MLSLLSLIGLFILGVIIWLNIPGRLWSYYKLCKAMKQLPSFPAHWLWGNLHQIHFTQAFADQVYNWRTENKINITCFWVGPFTAFVVINHPEYIKSLLKTSKCEPAYSMLKPWLGRGLLIENGERWFRNRRLLTPAFHFDILKPYIHVYNECTNILLSKWEASAIKGTTVEVYKSISQLTLDIILRCACSYHSNCQEQDVNNPYVNAVQDLFDLSYVRYLSPVLAANELFFMYCSRQGQQYRRALKIAHSHSEKIIKERKLSLRISDGIKRRQSEVFQVAKSSRNRLDFLDTLLTTMDDKGCGLTDLEIRNEVDTFVFEGYDTTANGLLWTLYLLAKHPEHQEKCREEMKDILRGRDHLDYEDLSKFQYIQWCIKESMRMYPPVHNIHRQLDQDMWIGGFYIPKETMITIDIAGIHRNPEIWENPKEYNPLRFHPDNCKNRHSFSYMPFSAGPRNCIGQNFAFNEELVVIGSILNKFSLEIIDPRIKEQLDVLPVVLLRPAEELYLKLTLIE